MLWEAVRTPQSLLARPPCPREPHEPVTKPHMSMQPTMSSTTYSAIPPALLHSGTQTTAQKRTGTPPGMSQTPPDVSQPPGMLGTLTTGWIC